MLGKNNPMKATPFRGYGRSYPANLDFGVPRRNFFVSLIKYDNNMIVWRIQKNAKRVSNL